MLRTKLDTSSEMHIIRFNNGIKLIRPEQIKSHNAPSISHILNLPLPVYFETNQHITINCNEIYAEACGFSSLSDCLNNEWFKPFKKKSILPSLANDEDVVLNNRYKIVEEQALRKDDISVHTLSVRMPWYDANNKIGGLFGCSIMLDKHNLADSLSLIQQAGLLDYSSANKISSAKIYNQNLSKRETQCLQLSVRGKSAAMVAKYLGISQRTVEEYLNNIKLKFGVSSKSELIDVAIDYFRDI
jgi:DNA-binding CsgD family transcriptional regulator